MSATSRPWPGGAQAARVHGLQQGAVAQGGGVGPARLAQQLRDLVAGKHLRELRPCLGTRRSAVGSSARTPVAAQVAVEGAQAGDLALQGGRRRRGPALAPGGQLVREAGELAVADRQRVGAAALQPAPNCSRSDR